MRATGNKATQNNSECIEAAGRTCLKQSLAIVTVNAGLMPYRRAVCKQLRKSKIAVAIFNNNGR